METGKLVSRLKELREKSSAGEARKSELDAALAQRNLNGDELAETAELAKSLAETAEQIVAIERTLRVGAFSPNANDPVGLTPKEKGEYSLAKLIRAAHPMASEAEKSVAGLELEASHAMERSLNRVTRGAYIPAEIMGEQRDMAISQFAKGGALVGVDFRAQDLIPLLRNKLALTQLGVRYMDGLSSDVTVPEHTAGGTAGWVAREGGNLPETDQQVGQIAMTPKTLGCFSIYGHQLLTQASVDVEQFVRSDLMAAMALEMDRAALHGTGVDGQPLGLSNVSGTNSQSFATAGDPTRDEIIDMVTALEEDNIDAAGAVFATSPAVRGAMRKKEVSANTAVFLMNDSGLLGHRVAVTNQLESNKLILGNWQDLTVGRWGTFELLTDPFTSARSLQSKVYVYQFIDIVVRRKESFVLGE